MKTTTQVNPYHKSSFKVKQDLEIDRNDDGSTTYTITRFTRTEEIDFKTSVKLVDLTDKLNPYEGIIWNGSNSNVYPLNLTRNGYGDYKQHKSKTMAIASLKRIMQNLDYRGTSFTAGILKENNGFVIFSYA